jgi:hypothetical protein
MASASKLRMDRSKPFGTVHGERLPGDIHQNTHFYQDGMPFDANGHLILDAIEDPKIRAIAERKLKKLPAAKAVDAAEADVDDDDNDTGGDNTPPEPVAPGDVNLEAWLRGEASYPWFAITKAVRERHSSNISKQAEMVEFLVHDLKIVRPDEVGPDLQQHLKP